MSESKNPNPVSVPRRNKTPLKESYNLDDASPTSIVQEMVRERFTETILDSPNDITGLVLTKPELTAGEGGGPRELSVRGRVKKLHDYLPIVLGPPGEDSYAQKLELCKVNLHPVFTSTRPNLFANIGPGSQFIGELQFPEAPFEYYNGTLKSKYVSETNLHGLTPSETFRMCKDFLYPPASSAPSGQAQEGSANPGTTTPSYTSPSDNQAKQKCNTIYTVGNFQLASVLQISGPELQEGIEMIQHHEGFLPMLLGGYDRGYDSIGYGTLMSGKFAGNQPKIVAGILGLKSTDDLKPVPKSVWKKLGYMGNKTVPGNYTKITPAQGAKIMLETKLKPEIRVIKKTLNKNIKIADHQVMAMLALGYQLGVGRVKRLCRIINKAGSVQAASSDIYAFFLQYGSNFLEDGTKPKKFAAFKKRRLEEVEYFFGNKDYYKQKR